MLGTLQVKIYNLDSREMGVAEWTKLKNVRYFFAFFEGRRREFEDL